MLWRLLLWAQCGSSSSGTYSIVIVVVANYIVVVAIIGDEIARMQILTIAITINITIIIITNVIAITNIIITTTIAIAAPPQTPQLPIYPLQLLVLIPLLMLLKPTIFIIAVYITITIPPMILLIHPVL